MKKLLSVIAFLILFCGIGKAQFYNSFGNQDAFEWGLRIAEEQKMQQRKNPSTCLSNIVYYIGIRNLSDAEEWAEALADINEANGYYYVGLINELMGQTAYAKKMYQYAINAGNKNAQRWLNRLNQEGEFSKLEKENIFNYYLNLHSNVTNASAAVLNNIWDNSTSGSSSNRSAKSSGSCSKCNVTGWELTRYLHATGVYYYNSSGVRCPICGYSDKHYHYKCYH